MDNDGTLYVVNENGGGDAHHPAALDLQALGRPEQGPDRGRAE